MAKERLLFSKQMKNLKVSLINKLEKKKWRKEGEKEGGREGGREEEREGVEKK